VAAILPKDPNGVVDSRTIAASQKDKNAFQIIAELDCQIVLYPALRLLCLKRDWVKAIRIHVSGDNYLFAIEE
jgi:hypothetical protein